MATNALGAWIQAARLRTLPLSLSTILLGNAVAYPYFGMPDCDDPGEISGSIFLFSILTTLFLQILSNFANDYGDAKKGADNKDRIGPERAIQSGAISPKLMLRAIILFAALALFSGVGLLLVSFGSEMNWRFIIFLILGLAAIAAAIKYTVGKGAYGYSGMGDLFVFIFFGLVGVIGPYYLQTHEFHLNVIFPAATMGLLSVAVLNLNNMRDIENDRKVGKKTIVVLMGAKNAKIYHAALFLWAYLALALYLLDLPDFLQIMSALFISPIFGVHLYHVVQVFKIQDPKEFDPKLKLIAITTFLLSLALSFVLFIAFD